MIIALFCTLIIGILYGYLLYTEKMYILNQDRPTLGIFLNTFRQITLLAILFYLINNLTSNSILLIILFVSSYLSTVGILAYKR